MFTLLLLFSRTSLVSLKVMRILQTLFQMQSVGIFTAWFLEKQRRYIVCHALLVGMFTFESLAIERLSQFAKWKFTPAEESTMVGYG